MHEKKTEKLEELIYKLHQRFDGAVEFLKKTNISSTNRTKLFSLPWFLILGFHQTGKTSLLSHANLNFILSKKKHQDKQRATHCEWWATQEAVFLDVNNSYTLQSRSSRRLRKLWFDFLEQLKKVRPQQLFEGVIFTIDVEKLSTTHRNERHAYFHSIRGRLKDLILYSPQAFPLYIVITKMDKLAGFNEFFDNLSQDDLQQLWGINFNSPQIQTVQVLADNFDLEFDKLLGRLNQRLFHRLHFERNLDKRAMIKDFPLQVESIKKPLAAFLQNIADIVLATKSCQLRGIYFCSAQPQENAIDRLQQPLSHTFSLQAWLPNLAQMNYLPHFTTDIFKQILQDKDKKLHIDIYKKTKFNASLQWTIASACAILILSLSATWGRNFTANIAELNDTEQALAQYQVLASSQTEINIKQALPELNKLAIASDKAQHAKIPWFVRHFLPDDALAYQKANLVFQQMVELTAQKQIYAMLQEQLQHPNTASTTQLYNALQAYLMFNQTDKFNANFVINFLNAYWANQLTAPQLKELTGYLTQAFANVAPLSLDQNSVSEARLVLANLPKASLAQTLIAASLNPNENLVLKLPLIDNKPVFNSVSNQLIIPAAFTRQEFTEVYDSVLPAVANTLLNGNWVTNAAPTHYPLTAAALEEVRQFYMMSYINTWKAVLANLTLKPFNSYNEAEQVIASFAQSDSAVIQLIFQVVVNTNVRYRNEATPISMVFNQFNQSSTQILASNHNNLMQLAGYLAAIQQDKDPSMAALGLVKAHEALPEEQETDAYYAMNQQIQQLPYPYNYWFNDMLKYSWQLILNDAMQTINLAWKNTVYDEFNKIVNYYPFNMQATQDLTVADFNRFFSHDGTLNTFISYYIEPFVDTTQEPWKLKSFNGSSLPIASVTLTKLEQALAITQLFYPGADDNINISFLIRPQNISSNVNHIYLNINNQSADFSSNFMVSTRFSWLGNNVNNYVAMVVADKDGQQLNNNFSGPWSLFHWFDALNPQFNQNKFALTYQQQATQIAFTVENNQGNNPFITNLLHGFNLQANL